MSTLNFFLKGLIRIRKMVYNRMHSRLNMKKKVFLIPFPSHHHHGHPAL